MQLNEHKFLIGAGLIFLAAIVFAGALLILIWHDHAADVLQPPKAVPYKDASASIKQQLDAIPSIPRSAVNYNGKIVTASSQSITIDPSGDGSVPAVKIALDDATIIFKKGAQKSDAQYQQEVDAFEETIRRANRDDVYYQSPDQYEHMTLHPSDLKVGEWVLINATPGADPTAFRIEVF